MKEHIKVILFIAKFVIICFKVPPETSISPSLTPFSLIALGKRNLSAILIFSACSSIQITEEAVADQSVAGVSITSKSTATQAVLANAVVYFEYDQFNLTAKSIQALKGVSDLMKRNSKITISIADSLKKGNFSF